jgi:hypothetical protein
MYTVFFFGCFVAKNILSGYIPRIIIVISTWQQNYKGAIIYDEKLLNHFDSTFMHFIDPIYHEKPI